MKRLRAIRLRAGLTQIDLSNLSGVAQATISEAEIGHRKPHPSTLRRLARALDVNVSDFYEELPAPKAPPPQSPREQIAELRRQGSLTLRVETDGDDTLDLADLSDEVVEQLMQWLLRSKPEPGDRLALTIRTTPVGAREPMFVHLVPVALRPFGEWATEPGL